MSSSAILAPPGAASIVTASSRPPSTQIITSYITPTLTPGFPGQTPSVVVITSFAINSDDPSSTSGFYYKSNTISANPSQTSQPYSTRSYPATVQTPAPPSGIAPGAIAGITIGAIVGILLIAGIAFLLGLRGRRRRQHNGPAEEAEWHKPELDGNPVFRWASKARSRAVPVTGEVQELPGDMVQRPRAQQLSGQIPLQPPPAHTAHGVPEDRDNVETRSLGQVNGAILQQVNSVLEDPNLTHNPWTQDDDERNGRDNTHR